MSCTPGAVSSIPANANPQDQLLTVAAAVLAFAHPAPCGAKRSTYQHGSMLCVALNHAATGCRGLRPGREGGSREHVD
jgi:hypothetical protein